MGRACRDRSASSTRVRPDGGWAIRARLPFSTAADGVIYAELRFAPSLNTDAGSSRHEVLEAALEGMRRGSREAGITTGLIVDAMRNQNDSNEVVEAAIDFADEGVVGFDLAGPELGYPPEAHLEACKRAKEHLAGLTLHAGEAGRAGQHQKSHRALQSRSDRPRHPHH